MSALGHKRTSLRPCSALFSMDFYQCEFGLVQWVRYAIAAIESGLLPTISASSPCTRYRKGLSPVASPDLFLPLTWPQITSTGWPNVFSLTTRFIFTNSADAGFSIFAATVIFAFFRTGSDVSEGWSDGGLSVFSAIVVVAFFVAGSGVAEGCTGGGTSGSVMVRGFACSSAGSVSLLGLAAVGFAAIATFLNFTVVILRAGLNCAPFGSIGVVAAVLEEQPCEVHVSTTARCGMGQLQPIKVAQRAPMRSVLIKSIPRGQNPVPRVSWKAIMRR
jgi:hypothetical protein